MAPSTAFIPCLFALLAATPKEVAGGFGNWQFKKPKKPPHPCPNDPTDCLLCGFPRDQPWPVKLVRDKDPKTGHMKFRNVSLAGLCIKSEWDDTTPAGDWGTTGSPLYLQTPYYYTEDPSRMWNMQPIGREANMNGLIRLYLKNPTPENRATLTSRITHLGDLSIYYTRYAFRMKDEGYAWAIVELGRLKRLARHKWSAGEPRRRIAMRRNIMQAILKEVVSYDNLQLNDSFIEPPMAWRAKHMVPEMRAKLDRKRQEIAKKKAEYIWMKEEKKRKQAAQGGTPMDLAAMGDEDAVTDKLKADADAKDAKTKKPAKKTTTAKKTTASGKKTTTSGKTTAKKNKTVVTEDVKTAVDANAGQTTTSDEL